MKMTLISALCLCAGAAYGQSSGPSASPTSLSFSYQVNSTKLPAAGKVTVSLPKTSSSLPLSVSVTSVPAGWLTVTPDTGYSPLTLSVVVNPTSLTPGSYPGTITINTVPPGTSPATVAVTLSISNPPSTFQIASPSSNWSSGNGATAGTLTFTYTTGALATTPASSEVDIASTGDIIPFNVTASAAKGSSGSSSAVWLRVSASSSQLPSLTTSGSAFPGAYVPLAVSLDLPTVMTLNPGSYGGTISIAAVNAANGSATVSVNLVISAGAPRIDSIFPATLIAKPAVDPVITINGDNFFATSVVTIEQPGITPISVPSTLLSRKVLQATVKAAYLATFPVTWSLKVTNPAPPNNPSQAPASATFDVTDPSQPAIVSVVNAASYLPASTWTGSAKDTSGAGPLVSPREIISIFGANLGPPTVTTTTPTATPPSTTLIYPTTASGVQVLFQIGANTVAAPIIMTSANQINAVVPVEVAAVIGNSPQTATVQVMNGTAPTRKFTVTVVPYDPGAFTFGGLGQGQGAVLNYDSSGNATINSSKVAAPRGSAIAIYVTGMGDLSDTTIPNGAVAMSAVKLSADTTRVDIDGQPAVVTYSGSAPGAIAGLVQVNAIVPPTVSTGGAISVAVSVGDATGSRRSQANVTIGVK